jgi:hypothetical protein
MSSGTVIKYLLFAQRHTSPRPIASPLATRNLGWHHHHGHYRPKEREACDGCTARVRARAYCRDIRLMWLCARSTINCPISIQMTAPPSARTPDAPFPTFTPWRLSFPPPRACVVSKMYRLVIYQLTAVHLLTKDKKGRTLNRQNGQSTTAILNGPAMQNVKTRSVD